MSLFVYLTIWIINVVLKNQNYTKRLSQKCHTFPFHPHLPFFLPPAYPTCFNSHYHSVLVYSLCVCLCEQYKGAGKCLLFSSPLLTGKVTYCRYLFSFGYFPSTVFPKNCFMSIHRDCCHSVLLLKNSSLCGLP